MHKFRIVFVSNYFNHHQKPLSDALYTQTSGNYWFIATSHINAERRALGYKDSFSETYILQYDDCPKKCEALIQEADVVIVGSAPDKLVKKRICSNKLTFRYSERLYKSGFYRKDYLHHIVAAWRHHGRFQKYRLYMLCASAYTAADCSVFKNYTGRCYRWGYFTALKKYANVDMMMEGKKQNSILWVGRFLDWKHPDDAVLVASRLKQEGYTFELNVIGTGALEQHLTDMIAKYDLSDCVHILGPMKPEQVREHMEKAEIFLFTSGKEEGWGAVLNESMNSGCAVVASHAIGSVPFLLKNGENSLIYESGNVDMLFDSVKYLLDNPQRTQQLGEKAYQTIVSEWNAEIAAERLLKLADQLNKTGMCYLYRNGPGSAAEILHDDWHGSDK